MPRFSAASQCVFHFLCRSTWPVQVFFRVAPFASCLLFFTLFSAGVQAQSATATLSGTVTDEAGAVIPGVNITVINIAQVFQRSTSTNVDGRFVVPMLNPGNYSVKAEHAGFSPAELKDVILNVNDQRDIKVLLKVGSISQTVQIVDSSGLIDQSPAVATVVDRQFVSNLPLNGRSFQSLIFLTPGVTPTRTTSQNTGQFSVNGQRTNSNYFTVDGVSANVAVARFDSISQQAAGSLPALTSTGGTNNLVSIDALEEFEIQTSTYAPEFGRTAGAQVSLVTRSGTVDFHGSAFNYFRNDVFDANDWFANSNRLPRAPLRQNLFGGTFSGPVMLPRFGEGGKAFRKPERTFFFFSYEGLRLRQPQTSVTTVPAISLRLSAPTVIRPILNAFPFLRAGSSCSIETSQLVSLITISNTDAIRSALMISPQTAAAAIKSAAFWQSMQRAESLAKRIQPYQ